MNASDAFVCAIHLGTTSFSCVFSAASDDYVLAFIRNSDGRPVTRISSDVLLNSDGSMNTMGQEALDKYTDLKESGQYKDYYFFRRFKEILDDRMNFKKTAKLTDENGRKIEARTVFIGLIHHLKQEFLDNLKRGGDISDADIRWIIPVPITWKKVATEFILEVALKAGINRPQLTIVKESDVALRHFMLSSFASDHALLNHLGEKVMVMDCGGRKVDFTVYGIETEFRVSELYTANIAGFAGDLINSKLYGFLSEVFGIESIQNFLPEDFISNFDNKKRYLNQDTEKVIFTIPSSVAEDLGRDDRENISIRYAGKVYLNGLRLVVDGDIIREMFTETLTNITKYVDALLLNPKLNPLDTIILVGGLSASPMLQHLMKTKFKNVIYSDEPDLDVIKGAITYGKYPKPLEVLRGGMKHLFVAAIDFGTTFSGYAFSSTSSYADKPLEICNFTWTDEAGQFQSHKTSSSVLFRSDNTLHSVGFEADDTYASLAEDDNHIGWHYFKRFKMILYDCENLDRDKTLEDDQGNSMDAMIVFSAIIQFFKEHLVKECKAKVNYILESEIKWVLTVPAIWNDSSKQFMREAAEKAGIESDQLCLALEPEAASLFCRYSAIQNIGSDIVSLAEHTKYMILDCGGGTVDITVHEALGDNLIKEIYKANGGSWGGTTVDSAFWKMITDVFGEDVIQKFRNDNKWDELFVKQVFEIKKKSIKPDSDQNVVIKLTASLENTFNKMRDICLNDAIKMESKYNISWKRDKLIISAVTARSLFTTACESIVKHLRSLFSLPQIHDVQMILMVGGFSESKILQNAIKTHFPGVNVIVPHEAYMAVLNGAVLFGHDPNRLYSRVSRYTYGIESCLPYEDGVDDIKYLFVDRKGRKMCNKRFQVHVREGDEVTLGSPPSSQRVELTDPDQFHLYLSVLVSKKGCPRYVTDCTKIGEIRIDVDNVLRGVEVRKFKVEMIFGYIESIVKVTDVHTKKTVTAAFDFLG